MAVEENKKKKEEKLGWKRNAVLYMHDLLYMLVFIIKNRFYKKKRLILSL